MITYCKTMRLRPSFTTAGVPGHKIPVWSNMDELRVGNMSMIPPSNSGRESAHWCQQELLLYAITTESRTNETDPDEWEGPGTVSVNVERISSATAKQCWQVRCAKPSISSSIWLLQALTTNAKPGWTTRWEIYVFSARFSQNLSTGLPQPHSSWR
jgi:hypothetical protein